MNRLPHETGHFQLSSELEWIVASSSYFDVNLFSIDSVRNTIFAIVAASLLLVLPLTTRISSSNHQPIAGADERLRPNQRGLHSSC